MVNDGKTIWDNCLQIIRKEINPQAFKTWFEPIEPVRFDQETLTIQVPNNFFYEWIEEHYVHLMKKALIEVIGTSASLNYRILKTSTEASNAVKLNRPAPEDKTTEFRNPFVFPGLKKVKTDPNLNIQYTFDNFIEGECNRLPRNAGMAVAKKPGGTAFNPLVIYGNVGLGKAQLADASGIDALALQPNELILCVAYQKFTNQIIHSIKNNETQEVLLLYHQVDTLIVDDIQFLASNAKAQEIVFHIFNQVHQD